jgi:Zn-dependent metalloprotease
MFGISAVDSNLQIEKTQFSERGGTRVQFTQVFKEVPVLNSGYLVGVDNDSHIYFVNGPYHPEVDIDVVPALSTEEAVTIVQSDFSSSGREEISTPVLGIFPNVDDESEDYILVYRIEAADKEGAVSWRYLINAHTGDIVEKVDLIERVNGSGSVYQTNPLRGGVVNKVFYNLNNVNPRLLDGTHVRVLNDSTSEASSSSATFVYTPSNTHFDEAMVYYHSDRFER